jgi:hypothetical protein
MEVFVSYPQGDDESGKSKTEIRKLRENHCIISSALEESG